MADTNDTAGILVVAFVVLLAYFGWKGGRSTLTPTNAGSLPSGKGGCGCGTSKSPSSSPYTPANPAAGSTTTLTNLRHHAGANTPAAVPGSNSAASGSSAQWQGSTTTKSGSLTPRAVPSYPSAPGNGTWSGNARPTGVKGR